MAELEGSTDEAQVRDFLGLQLAEVEMLTSMFPNAQEFQLDETTDLSVIQDFVDGQLPLDALHCRIGFTVFLKIQTSDTEKQIEAVFRLPHEYPQVCPEVFIRAPFLTRQSHRCLSDDLHKYTDEELERGDICVGPIIQWLQDNLSQYTQDSDVFQKSHNSSSGKGESPTTKQSKKETHFTKFSRLWVYSHHIYSKIKRKDILEFAAELNLTGFCMPGKPGMIVLEGYSVDVEEFWQRIRRMQWKKLTLIEKEDCNISENNSVDDHRKFDNFEEKMFDPRPGKGRGAHMDLGLVYEFLEQRGCGHIFNLYFGVDGRKAAD